MSRRRRRSASVGHAVIGVILSYVLAIQLVATGFVATRMAIAASEDAVELCHGHGPDDGAADAGKTSHHGGHAACLVCAFASLSPPLPETAMVFSPRSGTTASFLLQPAFGRIGDDRHEPRNSQGPPQTA